MSGLENMFDNSIKCLSLTDGLYFYAILDTKKKPDSTMQRAFMNSVRSPSVIKIGLIVCLL